MTSAPRAVVDTTVLVSGFVTEAGVSGRLHQEERRGALTLCLSPEIIEELQSRLLERGGIPSRRSPSEVANQIASQRIIRYNPSAWSTATGVREMLAIAFVIYIGLGILQLAAIIAGLGDWIGLHWIVAVPIAAFLAYVPLIGTIIGLFGAVTVWGWSWFSAILLFFGPFFVMIVLGLIAAGINIMSNRRSA